MKYLILTTILFVSSLSAMYLTNFKIKDKKVTFTRHYKKKNKQPKDPFDIPDKYARRNLRIRRPKT